MKGSELTAADLFPLVAKLSPDEKVRLAYYALSIRARLKDSSDAAAYESKPVGPQEFAMAGEDPLSWDAEGWDDVA